MSAVLTEQIDRPGVAVADDEPAVVEMLLQMAQPGDHGSPRVRGPTRGKRRTLRGR